MDYPFLDNAEAGPMIWTPTGTWAVSDEDAFSPTHAWSDSPGTNYLNSVNNSLTLAAPLNLSAAITPQLVFHHQYALLAGDSGNVEVSANGGTDWSLLGQFTNGVKEWSLQRYSLAAYAGQTQVLVRFRLTTNSSGNADGWWIDNIGVAEQPTTVDAPVISDITSHTLRLAWAKNSDPLFSHYRVVRSATPGATVNSTVIAELHDQNATSWVDTGLALDTPYYYRVYSVSPYGTCSADGTESWARTQNNPLPFSDDFEGSLRAWTLTGAWSVATGTVYSGSFALCDSPGTNYAHSQDTWAQTAVNLVGTVWPVLTFRDRFALGGGDWLRLEVSSDGSNWTPLYGVYHTDSRSEWQRQQVDLSPWKGQANVRIRFRVSTDGDPATTADGWFVDGVEVAEHTPGGEYAPPLQETFEAGLDRWLAAGWVIDPTQAYEGSACVLDGTFARIGPSVSHHLVLQRELDLSGAVNPQVTLWVKARLTYRSWFRVDASQDGGVNWTELSGLGFSYTSDNPWTRQQSDLTSYAGKKIRLRVRTAASADAPEEEVRVDKLTIEERTPDVTLAPLTPGLKSMDLSWTASGLGADFQRYEIRRATTAGVAISSPLVAVVTNVAETVLTDTGLSIGQTYFYRLFVVNRNDTYSAGAERSGTTVPINLPLVDALEDTANWDINLGWGADSSQAHTGAVSMNESPGGNYEASKDYTMMTAVNLVGTVWPVLTFRDRFALGGGDWLRLEVSSDGSNWTPLYGVYHTDSRSEWQRQQVDLSPWKGQANVRIRFRVSTDGDPATTADGWFVDGVEVAEHTPGGEYAPPLQETFEAGLDRWLAAGWVIDPTQAYEGSACVLDGTFARIGPSVSHHLVLQRELDLSGAVNPQVTLWVKARLTYRSWFRVDASQDGGVNWTELSGLGFSYTSDNPWTRQQSDLTSYAGKKIRLRVRTAASADAPEEEVRVDKLTIEERTPDVTLAPLTPGLKSMDLSWTASGLGADFQRYEIRRATTAGVAISSPLVAVVTNVAETVLTDTGLSIGQTYFYRLFVVNQNDTYSAGAERSGTTVPINLPLVDALEDTANWDINLGWGADSSQAHTGAVSMNESPGGNYEASKDYTMMTAVNLVGTVWPVLTFRDRFALGGGDWLRLEVSSDGSNWTPLYGVYHTDSRSEWQRQQVDLSPWKGQANVRIRFRVSTDGDPATTADGWFVDGVEVAEHTPGGEYAPPLQETFEAGLDRWLAAGWVIDPTQAYEGSACVLDGTFARIGPSVSHHLVLQRELDLSGAVNPQVTLWVKARLTYRSWFRVDASQDGGVNWTELSGVGFSYTSDNPWTRQQSDLTSYAGKKIRLRVRTAASADAPEEEVRVDKLTVEERTPDVAFANPSPSTMAVQLSWETSGIGAAFHRYEIRRSTSANVTAAATLVGIFTNVNTTAHLDAGLEVGRLYYYRLFVVDQNDTYSLGVERSVLTTPQPLGFSDPMEDTAAWNTTGGWVPDPDNPHGGAMSAGDSPGSNYPPSADMMLYSAFDLSAASWPVLAFWDRFALGNGDWLRVEISPDGTNWTYLYGVHGIASRTTWARQRIDLSPWKGQANVRIRFHLASDGDAGTTADGWNVDDISVAEHVPAAPVNGFHDGFEAGLDNWLSSAWVIDTVSPHDGVACAYDGSFTRIGPSVTHYLTLAREIDLSGMTAPTLTLWARARLTYRSWYRAEVSNNGGVTWSELAGVGFSYTSDNPWTRQQADLSAYLGQTIRLRVRVNASADAPDEEVRIDNIGVGGPSPQAPVPLSPFNFESVVPLRPVLTVRNALDAQSDPLNYRFEVYGDEALTQLEASVPALAGGVGLTAWTVDIELPNNRQHWWRCRAHDGTNESPWSEVFSFYINHVNAPPYPVVPAGPPADSILPDLSSRLLWHPTADPDVGDDITAYQVQIALDPAFAALVVNDGGITLPDTTQVGTNWVHALPLSALAGAGGLQNDTVYHWRVRARDPSASWSDWSVGPLWFVFGHPPPTLQGASFESGVAPAIRMAWRRSGQPARVYFSPTLDPPDWRLVDGPLFGTNALIRIESGENAGFYKVESGE
jgi:alkylated DNA repair dioxygenase AlkB